MSTIAWIITPGRVAEIASTVGPAVYARSEDGRFRVSVTRYRGGLKGDRSYRYTFSAIDRATPSGALSYTEIPLTKGGESTDPEKALAAVERYAATMVTV